MEELAEDVVVTGTPISSSGELAAPSSSGAIDPHENIYSPPGWKPEKWYKRLCEAQNIKDDEDFGTLSILPRNIIQNIFSRIPLKKYVQLKKLSSGWNARVSRHLYSCSQRKILIPCNPLHSIEVSNPLHSIDVPKYSLIDHLYPGSTIVNGDTHIIIVGSLYGSAILMVDTYYTYRHKLFMYNPLIKTITNIPRQPEGTSQDDDSLMSDWRAYGFGYSKPFDPKIVILSKCGGMYSYYFSFAKKSWNRLKFEKSDIYITSVTATFVKKTRKLCWIAEKLFPDTNIALCLDLNTMIFQEIFFGSAIPIHTLGTFDGRLCGLFFIKKTEEEEEKEEEKEEKEVDGAQGQEVEQLEIYDRHLWWPTANKDGFYDVRVFSLNSNDWNTAYTTSLSDQQEFGKFYVMTFLDEGQILLKVFNKQENQDSTFHVYDIYKESSVELTFPPSIHVGNHHATEYKDLVEEGIGALRFPSTSNTTSSNDYSSSTMKDLFPDYEIEYWMEILMDLE